MLARIISSVVAACCIWCDGWSIAYCQDEPLTLKKASTLNDEQLVTRALSSLHDDVVYVQRPSSFVMFGQAWFNGLTLMLKPRQAEGYSGLCQAQFVQISFNTPRSYFAKLRAGPSNLPLVDPPVVASGISESTLFKFDGDIKFVPSNTPSDDCDRIHEPSEFIYAPNADSVYQAVRLMHIAVAGLSSGKNPYQIECGATPSLCRKMLTDIASKRLSNIQDCNVAIVKPDPTLKANICSLFTFSAARPGARAGQIWKVTIFAYEHNILYENGADIEQIIITPQMFVVD